VCLGIDANYSRHQCAKKRAISARFDGELRLIDVEGHRDNRVVLYLWYWDTRGKALLRARFLRGYDAAEFDGIDEVRVRLEELAGV